MENIEVYKAINAVQDDMAKIGISKDKVNKMQGYNFRGIDDVYGALAPLLARHKLCIIPYTLDRAVAERTTKAGGVLFYVTVHCEFHFISAIDGSKHIARTFGEAMDSGDKATNKALSAAYKYAAFQTFCIPVDGVDADAETHEVAPKTKDASVPTSREKSIVNDDVSEHLGDADDTVFAKIKSIDSKEGETNGKKWKVYFIQTSTEKYGTFDEKIADFANGLITSGELGRLQWKQGKKGKEVVALSI